MSHYNNKAQQIVRNTVYLYIRMFLVMGVTLYTSRVVLRVLGFEDFGIYNVVGSVVLFMSFLQAALRNATFRYITYELGKGEIEQLNITYSMAVNTHVILAFALFLVMEIGGVWFINSTLNISPERLSATNWTYQFSLVTFCISIIRTPYESNILAHERMDFYALTSIAEVVLRLASVLLLVISPIDKLAAYSALLMIVAIILLAWYMIYCCWKFKDTKYQMEWNKDVIRKFASYSGWALLVNGATITRSQCINIFFNLFLGVLANAAMGVANQVVGALNVFVTNLNQAFRPQLIKSWAENNKDYFMKIVLSSSKMSYFLLLLVAIPVVANIDFLLRIWLGDYPPMASVYVIAILLYYLVDAMQEPLVNSVHATGNLRFHQIMIASIVILVIPISYVMLSSGCSGTSVLVMNALANAVCALGRTIYMKRLINLDLYVYLHKVVTPIVIVTLLSAPLPIYMSRHYESTWGTFIMITMLSVVLTLLISYFIGLDTAEKKLLWSMPILSKIKSNSLCRK